MSKLSSVEEEKTIRTDCRRKKVVWRFFFGFFSRSARCALFDIFFSVHSTRSLQCEFSSIDWVLRRLCKFSQFTQQESVEFPTQISRFRSTCLIIEVIIKAGDCVYARVWERIYSGTFAKNQFRMWWRHFVDFWWRERDSTNTSGLPSSTFIT